MKKKQLYYGFFLANLAVVLAGIGLIVSDFIEGMTTKRIGERTIYGAFLIAMSLGLAVQLYKRYKAL